MTASLNIRYRFDLPDGSAKTLELTFGADDFQIAEADRRRRAVLD
jgi:hypothetical protein